MYSQKINPIKNKISSTLFCVVCLLFLAGNLFAEQEKLPLSFKWDLALLPQKNQAIAVLWIILEPDWHAYANDPWSAYAMPTTVRAWIEEKNSLPVTYPKGQPVLDQLTGATVQVYSGSTPIFIPFSPNSLTEKNELQAEIDLLLCSHSRCLPLNKTLKLQLTENILLTDAKKQPWWQFWLEAQEKDKELPPTVETTAPIEIKDFSFSPLSFTPDLEVSSLGKAALFAFLAGLILNFMPCVLPVIALKVRSLLPTDNRANSKQISTFRTHNLFFALGILVYFAFLAILFSLTEMVWGQLFQSPLVIIALIFIVFTLSLSLFGLYDLPVIDLKRKTADNPALESFLSGTLATLLATPCSGPFLGGVLAWGLLQPPLIITLVFLSIGLGMASPYILLATQPSLVRLLPKPGNWNIHLEQVFGFLLLATCVYLATLIPGDFIIPTLILLWFTALAAWIWGNFTSLTQSTWKRVTIRSTALLCLILLSLFLFQQNPEKETWQPFEEKLFLQSLGKKNIVLDFTADWCPNCKVLEKTVLTSNVIALAKKEYSALFFQIDLTRNEKKKMDLLKNLGSQSIPVVALFNTKEPDHPLILRDLFTKKQFNAALEQCFKK